MLKVIVETRHVHFIKHLCFSFDCKWKDELYTHPNIHILYGSFYKSQNDEGTTKP